MYIKWLPSPLLILVCLYASHSSAIVLQLESLSSALMLPEELDLLRDSNVDQFMKNLGIPHESLCHASEDDDDSLPMFNPDLPFGDLLMDEESENDADVEEDTNNISHDFASDGSIEEGQNSKSSETKWKNGIIPYYISMNDFSESQREKIKIAIDLMNSGLTRVYFRPYKHLEDENYVHIFSGKGCYARLGMAGGAQPVSLQANICLKTGIILHELMHVTGFAHEQNRPDRDYYVRVLYSNIPEKWWNEYKRKNPKDAAFVGKYDYFSVMHYPTASPGNLNKDALKIVEPDVNSKDVGNRPELSYKDIEKIDEYYS